MFIKHYWFFTNNGIIIVCVAPLCGSCVFCMSDELVWTLRLYAFPLAESMTANVLVCGVWSMKVHVVFWLTKPSWNISPGKLASCSCPASLLAVAMFPIVPCVLHVQPCMTRSRVVISCWGYGRKTSTACHLMPGMVCGAWAWEVQALRPPQRSTPTCSSRPSISWSTTWHRLAAVCWMTCDICLTYHPDVDCVWRCYLSSHVFHVSWTFVRP